MKKYKTISLFSGAMGLDIGLEKTGRFDILACVVKETAFCDTIRVNRDAGRLPADLKVFEGEISEIDPLEVLDAAGLKPGEVDLLVGGPPCQSFSTAGRRRAICDPRGTLLWQFLRFVDAMQPRFFLMENVRGLLSAALRHRPIADRPEKGGAPLESDEEPGSVIRLFADDLARLDHAYHMDCFEVNAVNYGAPQLRERALFIGNRYGSVVAFPDPTHGRPDQKNTMADLFDTREPLQSWQTLGDVIGDLNSRRGQIQGTDSRGNAQAVEAFVPLANMFGYVNELRSFTQGRAQYTMQFSHYDEVPQAVAQEVKEKLA